MATALTEQVTASLAEFSSKSRLYALTIDGTSAEYASLMVEAFAAEDMVQGIGSRDVIAVSVNAHLPLSELLGKAACLEVSLADGTLAKFSGVINEIAMLGSEGGLARYRLRLVPWLWYLSQTRNSRVWEEKSVIEIVDSVFASCGAWAQWRWSDETGPFMADVAVRSYCCQYRESNLDFVQRLLTEEGLAWRFEQGDDCLRMVLFADSTQLTAVPEDSSSEADGGIRFHNARAGERQDTVQALRAHRSMTASMTTLLSYDYKAKQLVSASAPSRLQFPKLPSMESFDVPGGYAFADAMHAQRYADLQMEGREARSQMWHGRSTVRTLRAGTRVTTYDAPLKSLGASPGFTVLRVTSVGVNNLPAPAQQALAELFGPIPELLQESVPRHESEDFALVLAQAQKSGYANSFEAIRSELPWRPMLPGSEGRNHPGHTALGSQSAIVVGAHGNDQASGVDELYCDRLGRVRIRFHWQDNAGSCWVRVAQRSAGGGMGSQFLPRIGQEVLVQFLENDIDRPIVVGALYNGQGEGGIAPTPAGKSAGAGQALCFDSAHDHAPSAQGNVAGGNSPLWHGASADSRGHRNGAAQWGVRSKEFGASGYTQLIFDDTDAQGRVQLRCSHSSTELNLGHLIHDADNFRGSFRGIGAELRSDAYGAIRAGAGLLITSYNLNHNARVRDPVGDNAACIALLKQAAGLGEAFNEAATKHETVALGAHVGSVKADSSKLDDKRSPLKALLTTVSGMVASTGLDAARSHAAEKSTRPFEGKLPHLADGVITISGKAGLAGVAGQSLQMANDETVILMSGQDTQFVTGSQMRMHTGQAIGVLGGSVKPGNTNMGFQMIAASGEIELGAQTDSVAVQARDEIKVFSTNAHVDWAAAKSISLSTAGGANITLTGGNITIQCPGKIVVHAGKKSFTGPTSFAYDMNATKGNTHYDELFVIRWPYDEMPVANRKFEITRGDGSVVRGITNANGETGLQKSIFAESLKLRLLPED